MNIGEKIKCERCGEEVKLIGEGLLKFTVGGCKPGFIAEKCKKCGLVNCIKKV